MAHLPLWVWVIEFQDSRLRTDNQPCVVAEIVFDSSSHDERPDISLLCTPSVAIDAKMLDPDEDGHREGYDPIWLAQTDGRHWRSLISDPLVSDREYGRDGDDPAPPGSPTLDTDLAPN
jgi:hypothetical protein